ncbi:MAG: hypothetical protein ACLFRD_12600 [Nitriliruptoraceae bacterium]
MELGPTDRRRHGRRRGLGVLVVIVLAVVLGLLLAAYVPRTLAEGDLDGETYQVRGAPGVFAPRLEVVTAERSTDVAPDTPASLDDTEVVMPTGGTDLTVVLGPTPRGIDSVRVDTEHGVGEAVIHRLLWRRVHVQVYEEPVDVSQLVGIGPRGEVVEVVAQQ